MRGFGGTVAVVALACAAWGCKGKALVDSGCQDDSDCGAEQRCERQPAPGQTPQIVGPCPLTPCTETANCTGDLVCGPPPPSSQAPSGGCFGKVCIAPCTEDSCADGMLCRASGLCEPINCTDPGGVTCPEHWLCDPDSERRGNQGVYSRGTILEDPPDYAALANGGCVRIACDTENGYLCAEHFACEPETASDPSGCEPIPCGVGGHCSDDERFICVPTSTESHADYYDEFGCVARNCEEGYDCEGLTSREGVEYCDFTAPNATADGCAIRTCVEGNPCVETFVCDPESPNANTLGCVPPDGSSGSSGTTGGAGGSGGSGGATSAGGSGGAGASAATGGTGGTSGTAGGSGGSGGGTTGGSGGGGGEGASTGGRGAAGNGGGDGPVSEIGPGRCVAR